MREEPQATAAPEKLHWGFFASVAVHAALLLLVVLMPGVDRLPLAPEQKIAVDVLSEADFAAETKPDLPAILRAPALPLAPPTDPTPPGGMVHAKTMLSARVLADPRSRQAREDLATFADSERILQLCNLEAMEQIEAWNGTYRPDNLVAYARSEETISGNTIKADGAAFHSGDQWYELRFDCDLAPTRDKVVAFAFEVGKPVPRRDWDRLSLPSGPGDD